MNVNFSPFWYQISSKIGVLYISRSCHVNVTSLRLTGKTSLYFVFSFVTICILLRFFSLNCFTKHWIIPKFTHIFFWFVLLALVLYLAFKLIYCSLFKFFDSLNFVKLTHVFKLPVIMVCCMSNLFNVERQN